MNLDTKVKKMDDLLVKGEMVMAVKEFFADEAKTSDYGDVTTSSRDQMVKKMEDFFGAIASVNEITHHRTLVDGHVSASEFTFDFDMKDGSKVHWHEIIRRIWNEEGKVEQEEYFQAGS